MALTSGTKLGPYEIQAPLGAGGMGEVYRACDTRLDRIVAVKILSTHLSGNPEIKQQREAHISSLNYSHICQPHDVGSRDSTDFLVKEFLEGGTLVEHTARGAMPLNQLSKICIAIAEALEVAHRAGIVHRDLKPGNIMLTRPGAKLMDFGPAKTQAIPAMTVAGTNAGLRSPSTPTVNLSSLTSHASPLTQRGSIVGTLQYMAPEVLQGAEADAHSDNFSFGCVLYEMATGERAFDGKSQVGVLLNSGKGTRADQRFATIGSGRARRADQDLACQIPIPVLAIGARSQNAVASHLGASLVSRALSPVRSA